MESLSTRATILRTIADLERLSKTVDDPEDALIDFMDLAPRLAVALREVVKHHDKKFGVFGNAEQHAFYDGWEEGMVEVAQAVAAALKGDS